MDDSRKFFFDTYAIFEIAKGSKNYENYVDDIGIVTTNLNLMELYYKLLTNFGIEMAELHYEKYKHFAVGISDNTIKSAMIFRAENKKKDLSYVDCIGYILASEHKIKFLTGDGQFEKMENVEFVK